MSAEQPAARFCGIAPMLPVADVAAAAAYYRDKLGFTIRPVMTDSDGYWVVAERDPIQIHLVQKDWGGGLHILVENVDQVAAELVARGARFESGPMNQQYGMRDFAVLDLDGHKLGFWQPLPLPAISPGADEPHQPRREGVDEPF